MGKPAASGNHPPHDRKNPPNTALRLAKAGKVGHSHPVQFPITEITDALLASYSRHGGINHLDGINLPSKASVADITRDLLRLVFPGFFDDHIIHSSELKAETALLIDSVVLPGRVGICVVGKDAVSAMP